MGDAIVALQNTPVPTILVFGGILFLFLGVVGKFVGQIDVPLERQKWALIIGIVLLLSGVLLYVTPPRNTPPTTPSSTLTSTPTVPAPSLTYTPRLPTATGTLPPTLSRTGTPTLDPFFVMNVGLSYSAHTDRSSSSWTLEQAENADCIRCHSGTAFPSFLNNPQSVVSWKGSGPPLNCLSCHKEDTQAAYFGLRVVGKPVGVLFIPSNIGLSALCQVCHNGRRSAEDFAQGKSESYPHYSNEAEMLNNTGGITYNQSVPNSPHSTIGTQPINNPANSSDPAAPKFLFSTIGDSTGNVPGPCVYCHMYPTITANNDVNYLKVGGHSFNTTSPDGKFDYVASCKSCHPDAKDFDFKAKADYDGNGRVEGVQEEIKGLLSVLWRELETKGAKRNEGFPHITLPSNADAKIKNAWYNFRYVYGRLWQSPSNNGNEGKAAAIHNFKRSVALLQLSYKDLTGRDVPNSVLMK